MIQRNLEQHLQELLDHTVREDPVVHGGILLIDAPCLQWKGASGVDSLNASTRLIPDDQFLAASITKMFTATGLMLLVEEGRLELDAKISRYLPEAFVSGLHVFEGRFYDQEISVRQLLNHTSGIPDFFGDGKHKGTRFPPFIEILLPDRF